MKMDKMKRIEIFQILGMEETKDERRIKNAYREKLSMTNPEDDPEGFKRLRSAYDTACRLAKESDDEPEEQPRDTTPSGLWLEKAADIYRNIHTRQDLRCWEELFKDDCFLSLEEEENCRFKLLRFLMEHFRLPTDVWRLLDKKLSISSERTKLKEQLPTDFVRYILNRCEHGEDADFSQFEGPEEGDYDLFMQYYDRAWQALANSRREEAEQCIENADRLGIRHPLMEICRGNLLEQQGKAAEALALLEGLWERYPEDSLVGYYTAEMMWKQGEKENGCFREKSVKIYQDLKEQNDTHYMANVRLTEWYYERGQYREAKSCAETVLSSGYDGNVMKLLGKINAEIEGGLEEEYRRTKKWEPALELCWCYLQDGKLSKGINLAVSLEKQLPPEKEAEFNGLMAKLYVEEAEYEDSITMTYAWEESLHKKLESEEPEEEKEKDRDRLKQVHLIRMQCYHNLGFRDREQFANAVEESKQLLTDSAKDIGILLEQAQIYMEMEEYEQCQELVDRLVEEYQVYAAYTISLEAYRKQCDAVGVVRSGSQCLQHFPDFTKAYEYLAEVYLNLNYREDLEKILAEAEKNKVKSDILNAYKYQLTHKIMEPAVLNDKLRNFRDKYLYFVIDILETDSNTAGANPSYEEGLKIITEYLYHHPDSYLFAERGEYYLEGHRYEEARKDYEKALSLNPSDCRGLRGLSKVYRALGNHEKALVYLKKAILYADAFMIRDLYQEMGELYSCLGDNRRALSAHLECLRITGNEKPGWTSLMDMMEARLRMEQLEEAEKVSAQMWGRDQPHDFNNRVILYERSGNEKKARETLEKWRRSLTAWRGTPGLGRADLIGRGSRYLDRRVRGDRQSEGSYGNFFGQAAWVELIFGDPGAALRYFRESIACNKDTLSYLAAGGIKIDAIFGCIVCGKDRQGEKYVEVLRKYLDENPVSFFGTQKRKLYCRILICFSTASPQEIQELLDQEKSTTHCEDCTRPFCSELEGLRILFLYRQGKQQEARERLERNLEILPQDEYMRAIKHIVFEIGSAK